MSQRRRPRKLRGAHDDLVMIVARRLRESGLYEWVKNHQDYSSRGLTGEWDVIAAPKHNGEFLHYYEIKSHDSPQAYHRALEQFQRTQRAFPDVNWQFVYITPQRIKRYKSGY